jgi:23S rRNA (guanosine2251-2'-O)-methyltransferase
MSRWIYGKHAVLERLRLTGNGLEFVALAKGMKESDSDAVLKAAKAAQVRVQWHPRGWLNEKTGSDKHQGVAASTGAFKYAELMDLIDSSKPESTVIVLDGVEDPGNLGAVLRSAECAGALGVVIPQDRAAQVTAVVEKASAGAASLIPVASVVNVSRALEDLKKAGYWIYGLAGQAKDSIYSQKFSGKVCIVMGGEGKGLRDLVAKNCDVLLNIPMSGRVESLNISVAAGVTLFEIQRQRGL